MASPVDSIWKFCHRQTRTSEVTNSMPVFRHPLLSSSFRLTKDSAVHDTLEVPKYDFIDPLGATVEEDSEKTLSNDWIWTLWRILRSKRTTFSTTPWRQRTMRD
ncbi:hypothetical protein KIN20_034744 [Parelaphostrongylus tenuis]|uniref:Uncharacterized protein n=1 Tax=Parelaphostrongylus tenuis TaxID=148309 RepID=A0AAD5WJX0_PARTN|nr:hypothetical protein KIN20_034744 [Parelaphostrongylus tenuis]